MKRIKNWQLVIILMSPFLALAAEVMAFVYVGIWAGFLLFPAVLFLAFGLTVFGPEAEARFRHWLDAPAQGPSQ